MSARSHREDLQILHDFREDDHQDHEDPLDHRTSLIDDDCGDVEEPLLPELVLNVVVPLVQQRVSGGGQGAEHHVHIGVHGFWRQSRAQFLVCLTRLLAHGQTLYPCSPVLSSAPSKT